MHNAKPKIKPSKTIFFKNAAERSAQKKKKERTKKKTNMLEKIVFVGIWFHWLVYERRKKKIMAQEGSLSQDPFSRNCHGTVVK